MPEEEETGTNMYIIFPDGDFDGNAELVAADNPNQAASKYLISGSNFVIGERVCVVLFDNVTTLEVGLVEVNE